MSHHEQAFAFPRVAELVKLRDVPPQTDQSARGTRQIAAYYAMASLGSEMC